MLTIAPRSLFCELKTFVAGREEVPKDCFWKYCEKRNLFNVSTWNNFCQTDKNSFRCFYSNDVISLAYINVFSRHLLFKSQQLKHQNNVCNLSKLNNRHQNNLNDVVLVSFLLTLNRFHIVLLFRLLTLSK